MAITYPTDLKKISDDRKTRRTWKRDSARRTTEQTIKEPEDAVEDFTSTLKSAQEQGRKNNGGARRKRVDFSHAIDQVRGEPGAGGLGHGISC